MPPRRANKSTTSAAIISLKAQQHGRQGFHTRSLWVPAIYNHGGFGRWAFLEINDPWDAINTIRSKVTYLFGEK